MKSMAFLSFILCTSVFANRGVITSDQLTETEINNLKGSYTNIKGFDIEVKIEKPTGQLDLFEPTKYEVEIDLDDYQAQDKVYLTTGTPYIDVEENGNVIMGLSDTDCDYPGCENTDTTLTFKKRSNGSYALTVEVEIEQYIDPGDGYEDDEIDDALCEEYLGTTWVRNVSYEGWGMCSGNATYFMNKK